MNEWHMHVLFFFTIFVKKTLNLFLKRDTLYYYTVYPQFCSGKVNFSLTQNQEGQCDSFGYSRNENETKGITLATVAGFCK